MTDEQFKTSRRRWFHHFHIVRGPLFTLHIQQAEIYAKGCCMLYISYVNQWISLNSYISYMNFPTLPYLICLPYALDYFFCRKISSLEPIKVFSVCFHCKRWLMNRLSFGTNEDRSPVTTDELKFIVKSAAYTTSRFTKIMTI